MPGVRTLGIACIALFGGFGLLGLRAAVGRAGFVALLDEGVLFEDGFSRTFMPWRAVAGPREQDISGTRFVGFETIDSGETEKSGLSGLLGPLERRWFGTDLSVAEHHLVVDLEVFVRTLELAWTTRAFTRSSVRARASRSSA